MPSPSFARSSSDSNISRTIKSESSIPSSKASIWFNKLESIVTRKNKSVNKPALTQEHLQVFNQRNDELYDKKPSSFVSGGYSPYYRGLTDSSLVLNRQKIADTSPGRESTESLTSSGSFSSFRAKVQEWSSCFTSLKEDEEDKPMKMVRSSKSTGSINTKNIRFSPSTSSSSSSLITSTTTTITTLEKEMGLKGRFMTSKSLRERVLKPSPPPPPSGPPVPPPLLPSPPSGPPISPPLPRSSPTLFELIPSSIHSPPPTPSMMPLVSSPPPSSPPPPLPPNLERPPPSPPPPPPAEESSSKALSSPQSETSKEANEEVYVLADRYRPVTLEDFICNRNKALEIQAKVKSGECGHFVFEGPPGVGKRTMIWAALREAYGAEKVKARKQSKQFTIKGDSVGSIEVTIKISSKHVEINLSDVKGYEKHVIVELIQEAVSRLAKDTVQCEKDDCQVIVVYEAEKLSADALQYIKWQLGRYGGCSKVFFCCTKISKLQPILPLCTVVKLLPPSNEEIVKVLEFVAEKEGIELPGDLAERIAINSNNNLRQAIRSFEATWHSNPLLTENPVILTGWEDDIVTIARSIKEEQSPKQLYKIRGMLQNLIEHNVCPKYIFKAMVEELKNILDEEFHLQLERFYDEYKNPVKSRYEETNKRHRDLVKEYGQRFLRIEEFIAKLMSWYKTKTTSKNSGINKGCED